MKRTIIAGNTCMKKEYTESELKRHPGLRGPDIYINGRLNGMGPKRAPKGK